MKLLTVVGARPQFVKAFPVSRALRVAGHEETIVHTGQHYDDELSDIFFEELAIPEPEFDLEVGSRTHGAQTAAMIDGLESVHAEAGPDAVLLYGDTNSTLAGAIVGSKADVMVAHVEAGLRSFNREMPEEVNRVLTDHAADLLFAPTDEAVSNLAAEGLTEAVYRTGDVMYDTLRWAKERAADSQILNDFGLAPGEYVLATVHRAANTDDPDRLESIVDGLAAVPLPVVFPAHPRTVDRLKRNGLFERTTDELRVVDPVGYLDFVRFLDDAARVATDSGGVQKEAFFLDTPCVTLRDETEWIETVECGWNELVGADSASIERALRAGRRLEDKPTPYGDGHAAEAIVEVLEDAR